MYSNLGFETFNYHTVMYHSSELNNNKSSVTLFGLNYGRKKGRNTIFCYYTYNIRIIQIPNFVFSL